ncbi:MAG: hypothetical protein ACSHX7_09905 [Luteolibacter sp.]
MSKIPSILEQQLENLRPAGLDEAFLNRLTACAEGEGELLSGEESLAESNLGQKAPSRVPEALQKKLLESIGDTPFSVDGTIVLFNKANKGQAPAGTRKHSNFMKFNIAAAAAVALLGSITALVYPGASGGSGQPMADRAPMTESAPLAEIASPVNYAPASYNRDLSSMRDEGVILQNDRPPYRSFGIIFRDKVTVENENGETIQIEQPRYERVLIPEKID